MSPYGSFQKDLEKLINKHSLERHFGDTPDYILAAATVKFLILFGGITRDRDAWYDYPKEKEIVQNLD